MIEVSIELIEGVICGIIELHCSIHRGVSVISSTFLNIIDFI